MSDFGDTSPAGLPEPRSLEELAAIAVAVERQAEGRYMAVARELRALGVPAELLEELGGEHEARGARLEAESAGEQRPVAAAQELARFLPRALSENGTAACDLLGLTPYRVLAFAVGLAQQSFKLYSYLAATADRPVRDFAERLAGGELARAARLRVRRRQAYHLERRGSAAVAFPTVGLVESQADLLAAALAIEGCLAERLAEAGEHDPGLSLACRATRERAERLGNASEQAGPPGGPMAAELEKFLSSAQAEEQADRDRAAAARRLLADCERVFSFYDAVASAPVDEAVMLLAQDLSQAAVERIRQVGASGNQSDEASRLHGNR